MKRVWWNVEGLGKELDSGSEPGMTGEWDVEKARKNAEEHSTEKEWRTSKSENGTDNADCFDHPDQKIIRIIVIRVIRVLFSLMDKNRVTEINSIVIPGSDPESSLLKQLAKTEEQRDREPIVIPGSDPKSSLFSIGGVNVAKSKKV